MVSIAAIAGRSRGQAPPVDVTDIEPEPRQAGHVSVKSIRAQLERDDLHPLVRDTLRWVLGELPYPPIAADNIAEHVARVWAAREAVRS